MWEMEKESQSAEEPIMSDPAVSAFLTQLLCAHDGRLLVSEIPEHLNLPPAHIASILLEESSRFLLLEQCGVVLALSAVRLCNNYLREQCQGLDCERLHLCRFFVLGKCFHRGKGNTCIFSHDTHSEYNKAVMKAHKIRNLNTQELQVLLLLNDPSFLPEVCMDYKGERKEGSCTKGVNCSKLHICGFFARDKCFHSRCNRSHNLLHPNAIRVLQARGLSKKMIENIQLMHVHLSNEAQKEPRINNVKGNPRSTTYTFHSRKATDAKNQQAYNPDVREPVCPLLPSSQPCATFTMFPKTHGSTRIFQTNKPGVQASVDCFPPPDPAPESAFISPTWAAQPTKPNVRTSVTPSPPPTATSTAYPLTSPLTRAPQTSKPGVQASVDCFPPVPHPAPAPASVPTPAFISPTWAAQPTKPNVRTSVTPSPPPIATSTTYPLTTPLTRAPQMNKPAVRTSEDWFSPPPPPSVPAYISPTWESQPNKPNVHVSVGLSPSTPTCIVHPVTTPLSRAPQTHKPVVRAYAGPPPPPATTTYTTYTGTSHHAGIPPTNKPAYTQASILASKALVPAPHRNTSESSSSFNMPVNVQPTAAADDKCPELHFYLPYRWQISEGTGEWRDLPSMEEIEKAYCDPNNTRYRSTHYNIDFEKMTSSLNQVRRLSTASSVTKSPDYILTTEWVWYWKDKFGKWIEYGKYGGQETITLASTDLESIYLADTKAVVPFEAGYQKYEIYFQDMIQRNVLHGTEKEVLRRPRFVSSEDVMKKKASTKGTRAPSAAQEIPAYWDRTALPKVGYQLVDILKGSSEFNKIQIKFEKTMFGYSLQKIERIQNPSLWQVYQTKMKEMKTQNNEKEVLEKKLFHGTNNCHVEDICRGNFGLSDYGVRATLYGNGIYFSRDASSSHQYHQTSSASRTMFLARVLVEDFAKGYANYTEPHPKCTHLKNVYDSSVDDECDPSVFVIFEKYQIYPEYILEYTENKTPGNTQGSAMGKVLYTVQGNVQGKAQVKPQDKKKKSNTDNTCCIS